MRLPAETTSLPTLPETRFAPFNLCRSPVFPRGIGAFILTPASYSRAFLSKPGEQGSEPVTPDPKVAPNTLQLLLQPLVKKIHPKQVLSG